MWEIKRTHRYIRTEDLLDLTALRGEREPVCATPTVGEESWKGWGKEEEERKRKERKKNYRGRERKKARQAERGGAMGLSGEGPAGCPL
jgi:hypothetical protein